MNDKDRRPRRRWFRFGLRTMFVVLTVFSLWLGWQAKIVRDRKKALAELRRRGADITTVALSSNFGIVWRRLIGVETVQQIWLPQAYPEADVVAVEEIFPEAEIISDTVPGIPPKYQFLYEPNQPHGEVEENAVRTALPYREISLEKMWMIGGYTITLHRDGRAEFLGGQGAPREGRYSGEVDILAYGRLCLLMEKLNLGKLPMDIRRRKDVGSGGAAIIVRAVKSDGGQPVQAREIHSCGPIELWAIQRSIAGIAADIDWKPEP